MHQSWKPKNRSSIRCSTLHNVKTGSETQPPHTQIGDGDNSHPPPQEIKWLGRGASKLARVYPAQPTCNMDPFIVGNADRKWSWPFTSIQLRMRCAIQPFLTMSSCRDPYLSTGTISHLQGVSIRTQKANPAPAHISNPTVYLPDKWWDIASINATSTPTSFPIPYITQSLYDILPYYQRHYIYNKHKSTARWAISWLTLVPRGLCFGVLLSQHLICFTRSRLHI